MGISFIWTPAERLQLDKINAAVKETSEKIQQLVSTAGISVDQAVRALGLYNTNSPSNVEDIIELNLEMQLYDEWSEDLPF